MSTSIVQANHGFFVLEIIYPKPYKLSKTPIIAWRIDMDTGIVPITPEVIGEGDPSKFIILYPDGSVTCPNTSYWPSTEVWLNDVSKEAKA